jgi:pyruvate,orthophosphate dikinase
MFFEGDRIDAMREMILADTRPSRRKALKKLLPIQRKDFEGIFTAMNGLPVTIRLLDPPLHEFLPHEDKAQPRLAKKMGVSRSSSWSSSASPQLHEFNPMLGHRGCRLGITYPEIRDAGAAIFEAAAACKKKRIEVQPEIMIPLVGTPRELKLLRDHRGGRRRSFKKEGHQVQATWSAR